MKKVVDICSIWSYDDIVKTGYVGERQAMYLDIYANSKEPLTSKEASVLVKEKFEIYTLNKFDGRRISELEEMGYLKKVDKIKCPYTKKMVNTWMFTGRKQPLPVRQVYKECPCCQGKGNIKVNEHYIPTEKQPDLFGGGE